MDVGQRAFAGRSRTGPAAIGVDGAAEAVRPDASSHHQQLRASRGDPGGESAGQTHFPGRWCWPNITDLAAVQHAEEHAPPEVVAGAIEFGVWSWAWARGLKIFGEMIAKICQGCWLYLGPKGVPVSGRSMEVS